MATTELSTTEFPPSGLDRSTNVLLLARAAGAAEQRACTDLLTAVASEPQDAVLAVTLTTSPRDQMDIWRAHADHELPKEMNLIGLGEKADSGGSTDGPEGTHVSIRAIKDARNLTQLGVEVTRGLSELADDDRQVAVCFDSVTTLLEANSRDRAFRFLHVLTGQVAGAEAIAHYHLDPTAHDEQTVNTLKSLFDAIIERTEEGEWRVQMRRPYGADDLTSHHS